MNAKEKYFLQAEGQLKAFENHFGGQFENVVSNGGYDEAQMVIQSLIESEEVEEREIGWAYSFWIYLLLQIQYAKETEKRQIYYYSVDDYREIALGYYWHFKKSDSISYMKGRVGGIYRNDALEYLDDRVKDGLGYYGKRIIGTLELVDRRKEVYEDKNKEREIVLFHSIDEGYFKAIIDFDESIFPEENRSSLIEEAKENARVAKKTLKLLKECMKPLDENENHFNQYWTPRWSEELNRDFITEAKKMAVYKE